MFLQLSVSHSVHRGATPRGEVGGSGWGGGLQAHTQGGCPGPHHGGVCPGPGLTRWIPACTEADPPPGKRLLLHPTGMHSCLTGHPTGLTSYLGSQLFYYPQNRCQNGSSIA